MCVCVRERESESQKVWIVVQPIRSFGLFNLKLKALKVTMQERKKEKQIRFFFSININYS